MILPHQGVLEIGIKKADIFPLNSKIVLRVVSSFHTGVLVLVLQSTHSSLRSHTGSEQDCVKHSVNIPYNSMSYKYSGVHKQHVKHSVNIPYNSTQTTYDASTPVHPYTICLHLFLYLELL